MFEHLVALESALDAVLPRPRLRGQLPGELVAAAHRWSEAVWKEAERLGPFPISAAEIVRGIQIAMRPVFVCGVHRSGTTLVRDLIDGHPALAVLPSEGSFYTNHRRHLSFAGLSAWRHFMACEWCRRFANPLNQPPYWLLGRSTPASSPSVAFMRALATWWPVVSENLAAASAWPLAAVALAFAGHGQEGAIDGAVHGWVEKTPTNEQFLTDLWRDFPEAKVVHIVRDPVAVMASRKTMEEYATGSFNALRRTLVDLARSYRIADGEHRVRDPRRRYLLIRFEDLLADPGRAIGCLAEFLGVENLPILHRPTSSGLSTAGNSSFGTGEAGTIDRTRARADVNLLSADEQLRLAVTVGDAAAAVSYAVPA
jgi:hypothetical protein